MSSSTSEIVWEVIWFRAKAGHKQDVLSSLQEMIDLSTAAAEPGNSEPALGHQIYQHSVNRPDEACVVIHWQSVENHDKLSQAPKFVAGSPKLIDEDIVPNIEGAFWPCMVQAGPVELVLGEDHGCEILEVRLPTSGSSDRLAEDVQRCLRDMEMPRGFLGSFCGSKIGEADCFIIVTKWDSPKVFEDASWVNNSEERLLSVLPAQARIAKRHQIYK